MQTSSRPHSVGSAVANPCFSASSQPGAAGRNGRIDTGGTRYFRIAALTIAACLSLPRGAHANFFSTDSTIDTPLLSGIIVGYANLIDQVAGLNGTSPTVTVVPGGEIGSCAAFNGSTLKVEGGRVYSSGVLSAVDNATISLSSGGSPETDKGGAFVARDHGTIIMTGGAIGSIAALGNGAINLTGGTIWGRLDLSGAAGGTASGVTVGYQVNGQFLEGMVNTRDSSSLDLGGVQVAFDVKAFNTSQIRMSSSTIHGGVEGSDTSSLTIVGGSVGGGVFGFNLNMSGGSVGGGVGVGGTGAVGSISNTSVGGGLSVNGAGSSLSASGGTVGGSAGAGGGATLSLSNIQIGSGVNGTNSTVTATGANITGEVAIQASVAPSTASITQSQIDGNVTATGVLSATKNATITINGGSISKGVTANDRSSITLISTTVGADVTANGGSPVGSLVEIQGSTVTGNASSKERGAEVRLSGGTVMGDLKASSRANVTILGGNVQGNLVLTGRSSGIMGGGSVAGTAELDAITFTMTGGNIAQKMSVTQFSQFNFSNGTLVEGLALSGESTTIMTGGAVGGNVTVDALSSLVMSGGTVLRDLQAQGSSIVSVQGGIIGSNLEAIGSAVVTFSAGTVGRDTFVGEVATLAVSDNAVLVGELRSRGASTVNITGGQIDGSVFAEESSGLNVSGSAVLAGTLSPRNASIVNITGGQIGETVFAEGSSKLNISDNASLFGGLSGSQTAKIKMSGGGVGISGIVLADDSTLELSGGFIAGRLRAEDRSSVAMLGGVVGSIEAGGDRITAGFTIGGGQIVGNALALNGGGILLVAGAVGGEVRASQSSFIEMEGGSVGGHLIAQDEATIKLSGGRVFGFLSGFGNSTIEVSGSPTVGGVRVADTCDFRILGGTILRPPQGGGGLAAGGQLQAAGVSEPPRLTISGGATISIFGGGLVATLVDPNFEGMFSQYQLSGLMSDGTPSDGGFFLIQNGTQATYRLVPGGYWTTDSGGSWGLAGNWASATVPEGPGALAGFPGVLTDPNSPAGIDLDGDRTLGSIRFDSANAYIIQPGSGGTLTLDNAGLPADIAVQSGHHQITAPVIARDDTTAFIAGGASLSLAEGITLAAGETFTKTGGGELAAAFVGGGSLNIDAGVTLILPGSVAGITTSSITVGANGTLGGTGPFSAAINVTGRLAPGNPVGTMMSSNTVTLGPGSGYNIGIANWNGAAGTGYDTLTANSVTITATAENTLTMHVDGSALTNFSESPRSFTIASAATPVTGLTAANWTVTTTNFPGTGVWSVRANGSILGLTYSPPGYDFWIAEFPGVDPSPAADTDGDTFIQLLEYVLGGDPSLPGEPLEPVGARTGSAFTFTFRRTDRSEGDTILVVRYASDLAGQWIEVPVGAVSGGNVSITENGTAPDTVAVTIPDPGSRIFAQLLVSKR